MPTKPTHLTTSAMAVAVDRCQPPKPPTWCRHHRLRSFPHPVPTLLDLDRCSPTSFHRSLSTPCLSSSPIPPAADPDNAARVEVVAGRRSPRIHALAVEAAVAVASGCQPVPASSGLGGAYILCNRAGESFAVLKPVDEEPGAFRPAARTCEAAVREAAAYLLDHDGFSGVPPTALIKISHPLFQPPGRRVASIQRFVPHDFDAGDLGPSRFSIASVHRIGILDVRLFNVDRHAGNILVKKSGSQCGEAAVTELVPIDHGLCLPELLDDPYFEWLHWPQAAVPFSGAETDYIASLDPFKDAELLRSELPLLHEPSIRILVLCTIFLKRAAGAGLCLADIGAMMTREFCGVQEGPSTLEALCKQAEDSMNSSSSSLKEEDDAEEDNGCKDCIQFEMDSEDEKLAVENVIDIPLILGSDSSGNPTMVVDCNDKDDDDKSEVKTGMITKSLSFSVASLNYESGGGFSGSKCDSFKGFSEEEWGVFLERFEQLLPVAFEARKSIRVKQRLGTSCKF